MDDPASTSTDILLSAVCQNVASLLAATPARPRRLSVRAGTVAVELEWPDPATPPTGQVALEPASAPAELGPAVDDDVFYIRATTVGTFYRSPEPGAGPFAHEGQEIRQHQQIGILEAMKMMLPIEADRPGRVVEFLVQNAAPVEFDTPLVALVPIAQ